VVARTGIKHHSGNFHKPLRERWLEDDRAVIEGYKEIACLAREGKRHFLMLKEAGAEVFVELAPDAEGVMIIDEKAEKEYATK